jgi:hypothetical protein
MICWISCGPGAGALEGLAINPHDRSVDIDDRAGEGVEGLSVAELRTIHER